ncbi:MAG: TetR/AcrR family transcriptional regulator [Chitinophagales bacterium]|nr:TetR/AcrR family transcriptional regulator [Chitinophagales bacterium]
MADTKRKILDASIKLFNENGMANVRLQQIASEIGISPGNLAYHFKNKEAIIDAINEGLYEEASEILSSYRLFPNLMDFDHQLTKYYGFIQKYPFYFLDLLEIERHYPQIRSKRKVHISKMISQIRKRFDYNKQRGLIIEEPRPGVYDSIARAIWVLITFWVPQSLVRKVEQAVDTREFKEMIWNQIYPYFTSKGIAEYDQLIRPLLEQHSSDN